MWLSAKFLRNSHRRAGQAARGCANTGQTFAKFTNWRIGGFVCDLTITESRVADPGCLFTVIILTQKIVF
jgi:hypothetical protein